MKYVSQTLVLVAFATALSACAENRAVAAQASDAPMAGPQTEKGMHSHDGGEPHSHHEGQKGAMTAHRHGSLQPLPGGVALRGNFVGRDGGEIGKVFLADTPNGLLVRIDVTGVEPGFHGVHLHEKGLCEPQEGFTTAGGHANPRGTAHGYLVADGSHGGDLPNAYAHEERHIRTDLFKGGYSLADFQDADGFAVMVHAKADDYESQPSGAAGERVACAAFPPQE